MSREKISQPLEHTNPSVFGAKVNDKKCIVRLIAERIGGDVGHGQEEAIATT